MTSRATIDDFLAQDHLAFIGVSRNSKEFANSVYLHLRSHGRVMHPVHRDPTVTSVEGDGAVSRIADLPGEVDGIVVMVPSAEVNEVVRAAIDHGIPRVWLYRGVGSGCVTAEAIQMCEASGVSVVAGACPFMFDGKPHGVHRVHAFFSARRILDAVPAP